jgi:hypothetical protein
LLEGSSPRRLRFASELLVENTMESGITRFLRQ